MSGEGHAAVLLKLARADLQALSVMESARDLSDAIFGFHAQQAVEKGLKALLCLHGIIYPRTHDLEELHLLLHDQNIAVPCWSEDFIGLTDFAVQYRYDFLPEIEPVKRDIVLRLVSDFIEGVEQEFHQ